MVDTNLSRARERERYTKNRLAFEDVFGDPFGGDDVQGYYSLLHHRSPIVIVSLDLDHNRSTCNPARPTLIDFFCDVDKIVHKVIRDKSTEERFFRAYLLEEDGTMGATERTRYQQSIGKLLRAYGVSPVAKYFTTMRRKAAKPKET